MFVVVNTSYASVRGPRISGTTHAIQRTGPPPIRRNISGLGSTPPTTCRLRTQSFISARASRVCLETYLGGSTISIDRAWHLVRHSHV